MANSQEAKMNQETRKIRFGLWYDFRNPARWRQPADRLYREILDQIAWSENNGFDDVWLSEHHFIEDGYLPSILPAAAAIAARTNRIRIASGVLLMPFHNPIRLAEDIATWSGGQHRRGLGYRQTDGGGFSPINSRKLPIIIGLVAMAVFTFVVAETPSNVVAVMAISAAVFFAGGASGMSWALASVAAPAHCTASLGSIQ